MSEMPKFDFSGSTVKTDEELAALDGPRKESKVFKPGRYDVTIANAEYKGLCKKDANWGDVTITLKGTGEKQCLDFLQVPFKDIVYGANKATFPFRRIRQFCSALGHEVTVTNVGDVMKTVFANPDKLVGKIVTVDMGYDSLYISYMGKRANGEKWYAIVDKEGKPMRDDKLELMEFPDFDAAALYAKEKKIDVQRFPRVLQYAKSAQQQQTTASTPW